MKSYTDIEQSRKLAEILPHESADMVYEGYKNELTNDINYTIDLVSSWKSSYPDRNIFEDWDDTFMPCWSLAALFNILPQGTRILKSATNDTYHCDCPKGNIDKWFGKSIDACYELILKLHEQKIL